jgi:hypothetical protein
MSRIKISGLFITPIDECYPQKAQARQDGVVKPLSMFKTNIFDTDREEDKPTDLSECGTAISTTTNSPVGGVAAGKTVSFTTMASKYCGSNNLKLTNCLQRSWRLKLQHHKTKCLDRLLASLTTNQGNFKGKQ